MIGACGIVSRASASAIVALAAFCSTATHAQLSPSQISEERASISTARSAAGKTLATKLEACRHVFLTTDCNNDANAEWRKIRRGLDARAAAVDQIERKQKAAARLEELDRKQDDAAQKGRADSAAERVQAGREKEEQERTNAVAATAAASSASAAAAMRADRLRNAAPRCTGACANANAAKAAEGAAALARKRQEAEEHRQAVLERNAHRDPAKVKPPLPDPPAPKPRAAAPAASAGGP